MKKPTVGAVVVLVVAALLAVIWQQQCMKRARVEIADLQDRLVTEIPALQEENQSLEEQLETATERLQSALGDLMRLRGQSVKMRQLEEEVDRVKAERDRLASVNQQGATKTPEEADQRQEISVMDQNFGVGTQDLADQALYWATTLADYANAHDGQYPSSLSKAFAAASRLSDAQQARMLSGINRFELVYHGNWRDLAKLPYEEIKEIIVVRERQPWVGADGKWHKVYGLALGGGQLRTADNRDFFSNFEGVRIIQ